MKWKTMDAGYKLGKGKYGEYRIRGTYREWWIEYHSKDNIIRNLGWSPTLELAKKRCEELEKYFIRRGGDE